MNMNQTHIFPRIHQITTIKKNKTTKIILNEKKKDEEETRKEIFQTTELIIQNTPIQDTIRQKS